MDRTGSFYPLPFSSCAEPKMVWGAVLRELYAAACSADLVECAASGGNDRVDGERSDPVESGV